MYKKAKLGTARRRDCQLFGTAVALFTRNNGLSDAMYEHAHPLIKQILLALSVMAVVGHGRPSQWWTDFCPLRGGRLVVVACLIKL